MRIKDGCGQIQALSRWVGPPAFPMRTGRAGVGHYRRRGRRGTSGSAMSDYDSPSARYRRLAAECLQVSSTFPLGDRRTVLLQMAQVWQRLSDEYEGATPPLLRPDAGASPTLQQQQQRQP